MSWPDWDFNLHESFIMARGDIVVHEKAVACPCRAEDTHASFIQKDGQPARIRRLGCQSCHGDGFIYRDARQIRGLITGINPGRRNLVDVGYSLPGDCTFSPSLRNAFISDFDKITFTQSDPVSDGQIILRGAAQLDTNQFIVTDLGANEDRLWYNVDCVIWCEDESGVVYTQNTDFTISQNKIVWLQGGKSPDVSTFYTIKYTAFLEWVAYNTPVSRVDHGRDLGQRVPLRKKHIVFINEVDKATPQKRQAEEESFTTRTKL